MGRRHLAIWIWDQLNITLCICYNYQNSFQQQNSYTSAWAPRTFAWWDPQQFLVGQVRPPLASWARCGPRKSRNFVTFWHFFCYTLPFKPTWISLMRQATTMPSVVLPLPIWHEKTHWVEAGSSFKDSSMMSKQLSAGAPSSTTGTRMQLTWRGTCRGEVVLARKYTGIFFSWIHVRGECLPDLEFFSLSVEFSSFSWVLSLFPLNFS